MEGAKGRGEGLYRIPGVAVVFHSSLTETIHDVLSFVFPSSQHVLDILFKAISPEARAGR